LWKDGVVVGSLPLQEVCDLMQTRLDAINQDDINKAKAKEIFDCREGKHYLTWQLFNKVGLYAAVKYYREIDPGSTLLEAKNIIDCLASLPNKFDDK
jgi:hypothetical protein